MSDMTPEPVDPLNAALYEFSECIGSALEDICSYGVTIGERYVPFDPDDEDDEDCDVRCSQAWVRVTDVQTSSESSWSGDCATTLRIGLEVGVTRCVKVEDRGEAPTASAVREASVQAMDDMRAIHCAAMSCGVWDSIEAHEWSPEGPSGGQYGGQWTFTVEVG